MEAWRQELYLQHHGILGMHWGKRNGPPYPLGASQHSASEKKAGWRKSLNGGSDEHSGKKKSLTNGGGNGIKRAVSSAKSKVVSTVKKSAENVKSDYHEGLKAQYLEKHNKKTLFHKPEGKTEEDAEKYAKSKEKVQKALLIAGGVTIAAATAYYAYNKAVPEYVDRTLKSGTEFARVVGSSNSDINRTFYMARSKGDRTKYIGLLGKQIKDSGGDPHQLIGKIQSDMKIASNKAASETFRELYKTDENFRTMANQRIKDIPSLLGPFGMIGPAGRVGAKAIERIDTNKTNSAADFKNLYEAFNFTFTEHGKESDVAVDKFYEALKKKGYGAINDINDQQYSGYNTRTANIVFDVDNVVKTSIREIGDQEISKITSDEAIKNYVKYLAVTGGSYAAMIEAGLVAQTIKKGKQAKKEKEDRLQEQEEEKSKRKPKGEKS